MKQKRKVLFVVHQLNYGGVQKAILTALNAIDYSENEVTLYVRKNRIQLLPEVNKNVSKIIVNQDRTHYYRKLYSVFLLVCKNCCRLLGLVNKADAFQQKVVAYLNKSQMEYEKKHYFNDKQEYDVAISYIQGYTSKFVAEYIKAKKKILFYHVSTDENHHIHEKSMAYYDVIVGVNENVQHVLEGLYPDYANKMTFVENYVDAEEIRAKSKEYDVSIDNNKIVLCSCGRFAPVKGFDLAVKAAAKLKVKGLEFVWYFVGDGPERLMIESLIREYGLEEYIYITGMKDNPYPYIGCCDIYVQPSYEEAHPLSIIEAFILCKPVISTDTVGGKSLIVNGKNGLIVEINEYAIAKGITFTIEQSESYQSIVDYLRIIDYSKNFEDYKNKWKQLLEE